ncbi:MAG TPA: ABC transporter permease, partial [Chryseolinea sp.]|nr:ABC transporter permease [Chryseolinea sp.]
MKAHKPIPSKLPKKLLLRFLRDDLAEEVLGDLEEKFYSTLNEKSLFKAQLNYWYQVFHYLRPFAIRKSESTNLNHYAMFQSYFKIGWRNLLKNKGYSVINIGGLALGLSVAGLIALWVYDEWSFNQYHRNYSRITQIMKGSTFDGKYWEGQDYLPYPLIPELNASYGSDFKHIVPSNGTSGYILSTEEKVILATGSYVGSGAPEMFSFEMIYGDWSGLKQQESIMLSKSTAYALFGNADPINENVTIGNSQLVKVTGIYEDFPKNSALFGTKFFAPWDLHMANNPWIKDQGWDNHFLLLYAEIQPNTTLEKVSENIKEAEIRAIRDLDYMKQELKYNPQVLLHPMKDWHLRSNFKDGTVDRGPGQFVLYMIIIGSFILLLACINFMNLSTARSEKRAKEVGIRKTMGSIKGQLISQFFSESFLVVGFAFFAAIVLVNFFLPLFNDFSGKAIRMPFGNIWFWIISLSIVLITGVLAGSYPALYLSSFNPVKVLKGAFRAGRFASVPRKVLVVMQF